uniref:F-box domain-containing protein n=1 Tax=Cladonia uncialis subsp. uncialis TaxID=180999 RepID=A0A2K9YD07_CLAUC|nr:hypothetical protein [Cladonia uncialis subsp. uncialis]
MSLRFPTLAIEIIELIATFVELADLRSLRLVCRELNRKTLNSFGLATFATIQTDLSHKSLERIRSISKSEHFAIHVQCLHVKDSADGIIGQGFDWPRHSSGCLAGNLHGTDLLRDLLSQRLLNCRSFLIYSYDEYEPRHDTDRLVPSDAVGLILSIVAEADLALQSFTVQSSHHGNGRLDTPRLQMPLSQTLEFVKAWSQIEELVLDYAITPDQWNWVLHLISSVLKLRKLSLGFYEGDTSFMQRLSSLHELNRLEELGLGSARVTVDAITPLLLKNRDTLHSLSLQYTALDDEGKWSTVLENMKGQFPQLQNLVLFWLKQGTNNSRIIFSKLLKYPALPGSEVRGPNDRLKYDSRRIESMGDPIRLRYWGIGQMVVGVEYHGKETDQVLSALVDTVETN